MSREKAAEKPCAFWALAIEHEIAALLLELKCGGSKSHSRWAGGCSPVGGGNNAEIWGVGNVSRKDLIRLRTGGDQERLFILEDP